MKKTAIIITIAFLCVLSACSADSPSDSAAPAPGWTTISADTAHQMMTESDDYILLDVRTEEEYRDQRIDGSVLIPVDEISIRAEAELPDKDATILVYCRSGRRSASAAEELAALGYTNVYDFGGIQSWPYETVSG